MFSSRCALSIFIGVSSLISSIHSWTTPITDNHNIRFINKLQPYRTTTTTTTTTKLYAFETKDKPATDVVSKSEMEETTEQYGLEAGLFKSLKKKDGGQSAKDLLAKYGVAYLATSIPLALVSFGICYVLVDSGVDMGGLLGNIGIEVNESGEKVGTFALAYAAHKAASPIRFPPTVLLTPVVAKLIGKEPKVEDGEEEVSV